MGGKELQPPITVSALDGKPVRLIGPKQQKVFGILQKKPDARIPEIMDDSGFKRGEVMNALDSLRNHNVIPRPTPQEANAKRKQTKAATPRPMEREVARAYKQGRLEEKIAKGELSRRQANNALKRLRARGDLPRPSKEETSKKHSEAKVRNAYFTEYSAICKTLGMTNPEIAREFFWTTWYHVGRANKRAEKNGVLEKVSELSEKERIIRKEELLKILQDQVGRKLIQYLVPGDLVYYRTDLERSHAFLGSEEREGQLYAKVDGGDIAILFPPYLFAERFCLESHFKA